MIDTPELPASPISPVEAEEIMQGDVVALISLNPVCALARAIADALAALDICLEAHKPDPDADED